MRDSAIIPTSVLTGRRRAEAMGMKVGNLMLDGETADYIWRGKGGKQGHRELPQPALNAISAALGAYGKEMAVKNRTRAKDSPLVRFTVTCSDIFKKAGITPSGVYIFRHTAVKL